MNLLNDPMAAAFIPLVLLLLVGWAMYWVLSQEDFNHGWWISLLQALRLAPKEPEPDVPLGTKMNVLYLGPDRDARAPVKPAPVDYSPVIDRSRVFFKWLGLVMLVLTAVHGFRYYRRSNPYFIWGPTPTKFVNPGQRGELPKRVPGAGGAGAAPVPGGHVPQNQAPGRPGAPAVPSPSPSGAAPLPPPGASGGMPR